MKKTALILCILISGFSLSISAQDTTDYRSEDLLKAVNDYRATKGLPAIPFSPALTIVAQAHVRDLQDNSPEGGECNMHSWSDKGTWKACCYLSNHSKANCMWNKPRELTKYQGNGYEIAAFAANIQPTDAIRLWKNSSSHDDVILNKSIWDVPWQACGAAIYGAYAVVWFGNEKDLTVIKKN